MTYVMNCLVKLVFVSILIRGIIIIFEGNSYEKYLKLFEGCLLTYLWYQYLEEIITYVINIISW